MPTLSGYQRWNLRDTIYNRSLPSTSRTAYSVENPQCHQLPRTGVRCDASVRCTTVDKHDHSVGKLSGCRQSTAVKTQEEIQRHELIASLHKEMYQKAHKLTKTVGQAVPTLRQAHCRIISHQDISGQTSEKDGVALVEHFRVLDKRKWRASRWRLGDQQAWRINRRWRKGRSSTCLWPASISGRTVRLTLVSRMGRFIVRPTGNVGNPTSNRCHMVRCGGSERSSANQRSKSGLLRC